MISPIEKKVSAPTTATHTGVDTSDRARKVEDEEGNEEEKEEEMVTMREEDTKQCHYFQSTDFLAVTSPFCDNLLNFYWKREHGEITLESAP